MRHKFNQGRTTELADQSLLNSHLLKGMSNNRGFKLAALNIVSLQAHIDELRVYMHSKVIDILAINESRLSSSISNGEVSIPGCILERNDPNRDGGGVALYIRNTITYELLDDYDDDRLEWLGIKVNKFMTKPFIVGTWCRPPDANAEILMAFESLIDRIEMLGLEVNIIGDFNCNVGATLLESHTKKLLGICNLYQYHQLIREPTSITEKTASRIDLFITNNNDLFSRSGVCHIGISDHSLIFAVRKFSLPKRSPLIVQSRQFRNFDGDLFRTDLSLVPWHLVYYELNPNSAWEMWSNMFLKISDFHAPKRSRKIRNNHAPWLTPELKKLMFQRDKLKRVANINKTETNWGSYKSACNNVNISIKKAKAEYYERYFEENMGDMRKTWKGINMIMGRSSRTTEISNIIVDDSCCTDPNDISNALNAHFTKIGPTLANSIPETGNSFEDFINPSISNFSLTETNVGVVHRLIKSLALNEATGLDGISSRLLREAADIVVPSLTYIINFSIRSGVFPDKWKVAKVLPVYKDDIKSEASNYRPISILPIVSKIIEKIIFNQLYEYLTTNSLLAESQPGFRPQHSTVTALLEATNDWYLNIDNGLLNGALFLDLKKAFDTVNHEILLRKLQIYGVDLHSLRWFKSYLSNRKQSTFVNGTQSSYLYILCGVPQGSVLGPLLFLVYINDIEQCELSSKVEMYADTSLTTSSPDPMTLEFKLNSDLKKIQNWLHSNKLTLNVKKTKYAIIGSRYKLNNLNHDFIVCLL